jgi:hypothetical protein
VRLQAFPEHALLLRQLHRIEAAAFLQRQRGMNQRDAYRVVIKHNLVVAIEQVSIPEAEFANPTNLEVSAQLARNHMTSGCVDGEYLFGSLDDAKDFAVLSLDFARLLCEKALNDVKSHNFYANPSWYNARVPSPLDK